MVSVCTAAGNSDSNNPQPGIVFTMFPVLPYILQVIVALQSSLDVNVFPSQAIAFPTKGCALLFLPCWQCKCANLILKAWFLLWDQMLGF